MKLISLLAVSKIPNKTLILTQEAKKTSISALQKMTSIEILVEKKESSPTQNLLTKQRESEKVEIRNE